MNGIGQIAGAVNSLLGGGGASAKAETPFAGVFRSMVEQTSALDKKASEAVTGLLNGQGVEIHDAMIATQKADMAFELALQVRNKAVAAYQQMMGMQF
ncbi:MAG: flagellar hook-basal body complex subunit FliE [Edaphobacter sp.]|nr:flagellar hook-basal body complex subunit FliE [Edaphobacter sp.]